MIEVTSRHMECAHFNSDYSQMPAVALHYPCVYESSMSAGYEIA